MLIWRYPSVTILSNVRSTFESWFREWLCKTVSSRISLSLLSFSSVLYVFMVAVSMVLVCKVTYKVWSVFYFCGWLHPQKLNTTNFLCTKYFYHEIFGVWRTCMGSILSWISLSFPNIMITINFVNFCSKVYIKLHCCWKQNNNCSMWRHLWSY